MIIIGAGMSGLLCGALNPGSVIYEAGPERESDHKALFRCKTNEIGKILGIPFKKVNVQKGLWDNGHIEPSIRSAHMYSQKVTGKITGRSIMNLDPGVRYIPPLDFSNRLKVMCDIRYNFKFTGQTFAQPAVSTIPMNYMSDMVGLRDKTTSWESEQIYVNRIQIPDCDSYCTMYYPGEESSAYRASLSGDVLIIESMIRLNHNSLAHIFESFGLPLLKKTTGESLTNTKQKMGKIYPIDEKLRQKLITELTLKHNIYSLGRFATWRPKVMLDDVLEDIFVIRRLIEGGNYASLNHKQGVK